MKSHISNGLAIILGQVISALGSLMGVKLLSEYLTPPEYGKLTIGLTLALVINQLIMGPLSASVTRFYSAAQEKNESIEFLVTIIRLFIRVIFIVVLITVLAVLILWATNINGWIVIAVIAAAFSIMSGLNSIINGLWLANNQQIILSINQGLEPWLRTAGAVVMIILIKENGQIVLAGYIVGAALLLLIQFYLLRRFSIFFDKLNFMFPQLKLKSSLHWQHKIFSYSNPFVIWGIFTTLHIASDRWILQWYQGSKEVGYFAILYQIGYIPMTLLTGMMAQLLTPILFGIAGDGGDPLRLKIVNSVVNKAAVSAIVFMFIATLTSWYFSELIFKLLVSVEYNSLHKYLFMFVMAGGLFGIGQVLTLSTQSHNMMKKLMVVKIFCALLGILINFALASTFGLIGIAISLIVSTTVYFVCLVAITIATNGANHKQI